MSAPESVVAEVMKSLECRPFWATRCDEPHGECITEKHGGWSDRGCLAAVGVADAAWAASRRAALLEAAERLDDAGFGYSALNVREWAEEEA